MVFTSSAFWVPSAGASPNGTDSADPYSWCGLATCAAGALATFTPDPAIDSRKVGVGPSYQTLPFAADDKSIYWASFSLLGLPGSQIFATKSPTP
jgi:hypothetical protein